MISCDISTGLRRNELLKPYTTFKIGGPATFFASVLHPDDLRRAILFRDAERLDTFVLGGGSNVLISDSGFAGLVLHPANEGIEILHEDAESIFLRVDAAELWDNVVAHAVERGWWGIENLSHIPGQAGAALVQNIGAYGQQISDVFLSTEVFELRTGTLRTLSFEDCKLGYRTSTFNSTRKGELMIRSVTLRLNRNGQPNLKYPDLQRFFGEPGTSQPGITQVREGIITIRDRKFPFPREERGGNAGSFFKNLTLTEPQFAELKNRFRMQFHSTLYERLLAAATTLPGQARIKVAAALLVEACGLKGYRTGCAKVNETQPLVLLNEGGATATDVLSLAQHIRRTVYDMTGAVLALEPELVGFGQDELAEYLSLQ